MNCSIVEYYEMLKNHDWYWEMADDQEVWKAGGTQHKYLEAISLEKGLDYQRMWLQFNQAMFSGEPWGTEKVELPRINDYI